MSHITTRPALSLIDGSASSEPLPSLRGAPFLTLTGPYEPRENKQAHGPGLESLDRAMALGQMTGAVAQELENPLLRMLVSIRSLRDSLEYGQGALSPEEQIGRTAEALSAMEGEARRCYGAVQGLLDYAEVGNGPAVPVDLRELVEETLAPMRPGLEAQGIRLRRKFGQDAPLVFADRSRLQQALTNVVRNAQQALGNRGGTVTIGIETEAENSDRAAGVRLCVADNGPGIAPDVLPRIFDPFFTTRPGNLGLGLTIARQLLHECGGDIELESAPGKGTSVFLTLPTCRERSQAPDHTTVALRHVSRHIGARALLRVA